MRTRTRAYLVALPAVPYLFGVGLQVSGVTNVILSVAIFEIAALLATGVVWAIWCDWRTTAHSVPDKETAAHRFRCWRGIRLFRGVFLGPETIAAACVFIVANLAILAFVKLAEKPSTAAVKTGARILMSHGPLVKGTTTVKLTGTNRGDLIARARSQIGSTWALSDRLLTVAEEDALYKRALKAIPHQGSGVEFLQNDSRSVYVSLDMTDETYEAIASGTKYLYVISVISFTDDLVPAGGMAFASSCGRYHQKTDESFACLGHNETRLME